MGMVKKLALYAGIAALGVIVEKKTGLFTSTLGKVPGLGSLFV